MSVYKKMMQARILLQNTKLEKTGQNSFAKYKYFELSDFLPAAQKIMSDVGLCGIVSYAQDIATLTIVDVDDEKSQIVITSPMGSAALKGVHEVQNIGAVETYQRRYLWVTAFEIVEHDALDVGAEIDDEKQLLNKAIKNIANSQTKPDLKNHFESAVKILDAKYHETIKSTAKARQDFLNSAKES